MRTTEPHTATICPGIEEMLSFPLIEALLGRRSRRFFTT
jgi:hypothetical protein